MCAMNIHSLMFEWWVYCYVTTWLVTFHRRRQSPGMVFTSVCKSVFHTISQKMMQLGLPNLLWKCSSMSSGNPFILRLKGHKGGFESQKHCRCGSLHSCECWLLVVFVLHRSLKITYYNFKCNPTFRKQLEEIMLMRCWLGSWCGSVAGSWWWWE